MEMLIVAVLWLNWWRSANHCLCRSLPVAQPEDKEDGILVSRDTVPAESC